VAIHKKTFTHFIFSGLTGMLVLACTAKAPIISAPERPHSSRSAIESDAAREHRLTAAEELIEQGKKDLRNRRTDAAMRSFERSIQLHPDGWVPYYYMAEAWMQKGDLTRARQFNRLARTYADQNPYWKRRIRDQAQQLKRQD
jgi:Tfp pilus assembly protein PilF